VIDVEELVDKLDAILKTRMNPAIAEVNAEKADFILKDIPPLGIYFQSLNDETINYDPFCLYGISNEDITSSGYSSSSNLTFFVVIALSGQNNDFIDKRLLRYSRILKTVILSGFDSFRPELSSTGPIAFTDSNTNNFHKAIGLEFKVTIAT